MEIGPILALLTAVSFAMSAIFLRRGVAHAGESFSALVITTLTNVFIFSLVVTFASEWSKVWSLSWYGLALLGGAGILLSVIGRLLYYNSIRFIGANKAATITRTNILYAIILGIIVLDESLTIILTLGILCIIAGITLVSTEKQGVNEEKQAGPSGIRAKGIISGLGAGLCWGLAVVLIKSGIAEIGSPLAGAFVTYTTASLIIASLLLHKKQRGMLNQLHRSSLIPFVISGVFNSVANLFRFTALSYSPVSLVVPIMSTDVILIFILSFFLNRNLEVFTRKLITGMVVAVAGVILLFS